jgi:hypothetical protein
MLCSSASSRDMSAARERKCDRGLSCLQMSLSDAFLLLTIHSLLIAGVTFQVQMLPSEVAEVVSIFDSIGTVHRPSPIHRLNHVPLLIGACFLGSAVIWLTYFVTRLFQRVEVRTLRPIVAAFAASLAFLSAFWLYTYFKPYGMFT